MVDRTTRWAGSRRRWLAVVVGLILLVAAGRTAWRWWPLSEAERGFVGVWMLSEEKDPPQSLTSQIELRGDRVLLNGGGRASVAVGTWSATEGTLILSLDAPRPAVTWSPFYRTVPNYLRWVWRNGLEMRETMSVTWSSADQFHAKTTAHHPALATGTYWWRRATAREIDQED